jgi:hypothetical protein
LISSAEAFLATPRVSYGFVISRSGTGKAGTSAL